MAHTLIVDDAGTVLVVDPPTDAAGQPILPAETGYAAVEVDDAEHAKFGQHATYTYANGVVTVTPTPVDPPDPTAAADAAFYVAMSAATTVAQIKAATLAWMAARPGIAAPTAANG